MRERGQSCACRSVPVPADRVDKVDMGDAAVCPPTDALITELKCFPQLTSEALSALKHQKQKDESRMRKRQTEQWWRTAPPWWRWGWRHVMLTSGYDGGCFSFLIIRPAQRAPPPNLGPTQSDPAVSQGPAPALEPTLTKWRSSTCAIICMKALRQSGILSSALGHKKKEYLIILKQELHFLSASCGSCHKCFCLLSAKAKHSSSGSGFNILLETKVLEVLVVWNYWLQKVLWVFLLLFAASFMRHWFEWFLQIWWKATILPSFMAVKH